MFSKLVQGLILGATWRRIASDKEAVGKRLQAFARAEQGSFLTLRLAANQTQSPARAALYLRHAGDEARHAHLLKSHSEELLGRSSPLLADAEDLFATRGEVGFLAFVHHAEERGREHFELIAAELMRQEQAKTAELFVQIAREELHHERYAFALLLELAGSEAQLQRELSRVRRWEMWQAFRRSGENLGNTLYTVCILTLFPLFWLYGAWLRRSLKPRPGFVAR